MTTEPSASIWEVTRLILESPDRSPSEIAHEHGYSASEIAELMPIFLDTARTDWTQLGDTASTWTIPLGPDASGQDAELYLRDLAGSRSIEVAGPDGGIPVEDEAGEFSLGEDDPFDVEPSDTTSLDGGPSGAEPLDPHPFAAEPFSLEPADPEPAAAEPPAPELVEARSVDVVPFDSDPFEGDPYADDPYADDPFDDPTGPATTSAPAEVELDDPAADPYVG